MCGRFVVSYTYQELLDFLEQTFEITELDLGDYHPRYNVAPGQPVLSVIHDGKKYRVGTLQWGFVPSWSKDVNVGYKMINARGETIAEKPSFRSSFESKRCIILADAFYEWNRLDGSKQPLLIQMQDKQMFLMAGLWSKYIKEDGTNLFTTTIVTTRSNEMMETIHDRMPVILNLDEAIEWLNPKQRDVSVLQSFMKPYDSRLMTMYPVSTLVNNVKNDSVECLKKV